MHDALETGHKSFRYDLYTVGVRCEEPTTLGWLEAFLRPQFEPGDRAPCDCEVTLDGDATRFEELLEPRTAPDRGSGRELCARRGIRPPSSLAIAARGAGCL